MILDGMWEVKGADKKRMYTLVNIYNKREIKVSYAQLNRVKSGKDSVSRIITRRIRDKNPKINCVDNYVVKSYKKCVRRYYGRKNKK